MSSARTLPGINLRYGDETPGASRPGGSIGMRRKHFGRKLSRALKAGCVVAGSIQCWMPLGSLPSAAEEPGLGLRFLGSSAILCEGRIALCGTSTSLTSVLVPHPGSAKASPMRPIIGLRKRGVENDIVAPHYTSRATRPAHGAQHREPGRDQRAEVRESPCACPSPLTASP